MINQKSTIKLKPRCVALVAALSLLSACAKEPPAQEPVVAVKVAAVEKTTLHHTVTAQAILFPLEQSAITPKISAPVKSFLVKRGSSVRKNQLLATLENQDLAAAAQDTKGSYDQAQAVYETTTAADLPEQVQKAQLDTEAAKQLLQAQQTVYHSRQDLFQQGALPRKDLDQAGVDLTQAKNQYDIAQKHLEALLAIGKTQVLKSAAGQLESARGKYLGAQADLGYSEIRSPISGVVTDRPLYPGEMAAAGAPLLTVMNVSQVVARAHIPQTEAALLKVGNRATLSAAGEAEPVEGKVIVVSPALDPGSTTVEIWVQVKNPKQKLMPGTSVQISILAQSIPDALLIPAAALISAPEGAPAVMVVGPDDHAHQKSVKVGIRQDDEVQVLDGLSAGDKVVSAGAYGLPDGSKITIEAAPSPDSKDEQKPEPAAGKDDKNDPQP
jgi:multidrug efflux pump subunit AcrA (membrane-fusion protein)